MRDRNRLRARKQEQISEKFRTYAAESQLACRSMERRGSVVTGNDITTLKMAEMCF